MGSLSQPQLEKLINVRAFQFHQSGIKYNVVPQQVESETRVLSPSITYVKLVIQCRKEQSDRNWRKTIGVIYSRENSIPVWQLYYIHHTHLTIGPTIILFTNLHEQPPNRQGYTDSAIAGALHQHTKCSVKEQSAPKSRNSTNTD